VGKTDLVAQSKQHFHGRCAFLSDNVAKAGFETSKGNQIGNI